jgi:large subunit ribosomal protein L21
MYAIIEESGSQRKVMQGDEVLIDLHGEGQSKPGARVTFDRVLVVGSEGGSAKLGQPYVSGASVSGEVLESVVLGDKVHIQKFRDKKAWKKKTGHRQRYTRVKITAINA